MKTNKVIMVIFTVIVILITNFIVIRKTGIVYRFLLKKNIYEEIGINILNCKVINYNDTHGGIIYDGDLFVQVDCEKMNKQEITKIEGWRKIPLTQNLTYEIYGHESNKDRLFPTYAEKYNIPIIENGYFLFIDRYNKINKFDDINTENFQPYNYTLVIFDIDNNILYYLEHDV